MAVEIIATASCPFFMFNSRVFYLIVSELFFDIVAQHTFSMLYLFKF